MNINLMDHRLAHRRRLQRLTVLRCGVSLALGIALAAAHAAWTHEQHRVWASAWERAQAEARRLQAQQAVWDQQTQAWLAWEAQGQTWWRLGHESQMPLRIWHWLGSAASHGVRWTDWQQEGMHWTVSGEAGSVLDVQQWAVSGNHRPTPTDRQVVVSQTHQTEQGRIGFTLSWEELP
jgi:hypothetical protein